LKEKDLFGLTVSIGVAHHSGEQFVAWWTGSKENTTRSRKNKTQ
jgi:hypothetical protein